MFSRLILSSILMLGLCVPMAASAANVVFPLDATSAAEFRKQADELRRGMAQGGKYDKLSSEEQVRVGKQLDVLQGLYDKHQMRAKFGRKDELALINASEEINAVLSGNEDDRLICEQVRTIGSNRAQKVCMTVAERRARGDAARTDLRERRPLGTRGSGI